MGSSPALDQFFCVDFFRLCETFFRNFFNVSEGSTLHFFLFCKRMDVEKQPKGPSYIFRYKVTYQKLQKNSKNFWKFFLGTVEEST